MPVVTDTGFQPAEPFDFVSPDNLTDNALALDLTSDTDVLALCPLPESLKIIRVNFPNFADGRGFSIARRLRDFGYTAHLRASGHVLSDQYRYALASGFDDVEISDDLAKRQPHSHWQRQEPGNYRQKLRGT